MHTGRVDKQHERRGRRVFDCFAALNQREPPQGKLTARASEIFRAINPKQTSQNPDPSVHPRQEMLESVEKAARGQTTFEEASS
jgi:hypothetical protein